MKQERKKFKKKKIEDELIIQQTFTKYRIIRILMEYNTIA